MYISIFNLVAFVLIDIVLTVWLLHTQKKKFISFLKSENLRLTTEFQASATKFFQDGAKAMAEAMKKQWETLKRIQTTVPFVIATGEKLSNEQRMSVPGIKWDNYPTGKMPLLGPHLWQQAPIGFAFPFIDEGKLKTVINFREGLEELETYGDMIPTMCGTIEESHEDENGVMVIDKFSLLAVALNPNSSLDPTIKSINEQIKNK